MSTIDLAVRAGMAVVAIAMTQYQFGMLNTIDSQRLAQRPRPSPFHLRWLLPTVAGTNRWVWALLTWGSLVGTVLLWPGDLWAAGLWCCAPWFRFMANVPVTTDAGALCAALGARVARGWPGLALAAVGGTVTERVPIWQGLYSLRPEMTFIGLCAVGVVWKFASSGPRESKGAWATGRARAMRWTDATALLLPWGAGLVALLTLQDWTIQEYAIVVVAYGQMLAAFDTIRLTGWAAPVVCHRAMAPIPPRWRPAALIATWFNPWGSPKRRGEVLC